MSVLSVQRFGDHRNRKDQEDNDGATQMHVAAENGHRNVVRYLTEAGAQIDQGMNNARLPTGTCLSPIFSRCQATRSELLCERPREDREL